MRTIITILFNCFCVLCNAQNVYSLETCFELARTNNFSIKQAKNELAKAEIDKKVSLFSLTPTLSLNAAHIFSSGKIIDPVTNTFVNDDFSGGSVSMDAMLGIFNGMQRLNTIKQATYNVKAAKATAKKTELEIFTQIISSYANALYTNDLLQLLNDNNLRTAKELAVAEEKINVGKISKSEYYTINARFKNEQADIINAQNDSANALLQLATLLTADKNIFQPKNIDADLLNKMISKDIIEEELITILLKDHPVIKEAMFLQLAAERRMKAARGAGLPVLSLEGSLISNYNISYTDAIGNKIPVQRQLDNNFGRYAGIVLEVPLFQQGRTRLAIEKEKINLQNYNIALQEAQTILASNLKQLINNFYTAKNRYKVQEEALQESQKSYAVYEEKHKLGMISSLELVTAKNNLYNVQSAMLETHYQLFIAYQTVNLLEKFFK